MPLSFLDVTLMSRFSISWCSRASCSAHMVAVLFGQCADDVAALPADAAAERAWRSNAHTRRCALLRADAAAAALVPKEGGLAEGGRQDGGSRAGQAPLSVDDEGSPESFAAHSLAYAVCDLCGSWMGLRGKGGQDAVGSLSPFISSATLHPPTYGLRHSLLLVGWTGCLLAFGDLPYYPCLPSYILSLA